MFDFLKKYFSSINMFLSMLLSMLVVIAIFIQDRDINISGDYNIQNYIIFSVIFIISIVINFIITEVDCNKKEDKNVFTDRSNYIWPILLLIFMLSFHPLFNIYKIVDTVLNIEDPLMWIAALTGNLKYIVYLTTFIFIWLFSFIHNGNVKIDYCS